MICQWHMSQDSVDVRAGFALWRQRATRHLAPDLFGSHHDRPSPAVEHVRTALIRHALVHVRRSDGRRHGPQGLGLLTRGQPLCAAEI